MSHEPTAQSPAEPAIRLHALGGRSPLPELVADVRRLASLPPAARTQFWRVLGPSLAEPIPREVEPLLDRFLAAYDAPRDDLLGALRGCRLLIRGASALDVGLKPFADDLARLEGGGAVAEVLLPGYERARAQVRAELARKTLADHGRLLEGIHWRVDTQWSSDRVAGFKLPVVTLTLRYREGSRRDQMTFLVLPDLVQQLRDLCDRVLPRK